VDSRGSSGDADWDRDVRDETPTERLDRNWTDLLQELRVVQTGVQLLTGFLLTLPFQARFASLDSFQANVYLVTVATAVCSTAFLIAPVSLHRLLFRRHARARMVDAAHRLALTGMALLGVSLVGVVLLIFDVVRGRTAGLVAGAVIAVIVAILWLLMPLALRRDNGPANSL
jgi:hypothetical protein